MLSRTAQSPAVSRSSRRGASVAGAIARLSILAAAALPAIAQAIDAVRVTPITSFHYYAADTEAASGGLAGWPPVRYPKSPPLYAAGQTGAFLYGVAGLSDGGQPRGLTRVPGLYLLQPSPNVNYRVNNLWDAMQLGYAPLPVYGGGSTNAVAAREVGNLVRLGDGRMVGALVPPATLDVFGDDGAKLEAGGLFQTEFDGANARLIADSVGKLVHPTGVLVADAQDNVYGLDMGPDGNGRLFRLASDGSVSIVYAFAAQADGMPQMPNGIALGGDGAIYGILAFDRGLPGAADTPTALDTPTGLLYRIDPGQPASYSVLHTFTLQEGEFPSLHPGVRDASVTGAELALAYVIDGGDGWLYGTTSPGRCVAAATAATARYATMGLETAQCGRAYGSERSWSQSPLQAYPHYDGPRPYGAIYRIRKDGAGGVQWLHVFGDIDGANPRGPLALGKDGAIYGTTQAGGAKQSWRTYSDHVVCTIPSLCTPEQLERPVRNGTLYRIVPGRIRVDASGGVADGGFEHLHDFDKAVDGKTPIGVAAGSNGQLYGATVFGGAGYTNRSNQDIAEDVYGTLFQVNVDGSVVPPSVTLTVSPASGSPGTVADLTWTSYLATNCVASSTDQDWTGPVEDSGNVSLAKASGVYYYSLSCESSVDGSKISALATLRIDAPATADDGNSVSYGNGGAFPLFALGVMALAALWRRCGRARTHS